MSLKTGIKKLALSRVVDAMARSMEQDSESSKYKRKKQVEYEQDCREKLSVSKVKQHVEGGVVDVEGLDPETPAEGKEIIAKTGGVSLGDQREISGDMLLELDLQGSKWLEEQEVLMNLSSKLLEIIAIKRLAIEILLSGFVFDVEDFPMPWEGQNDNLERSDKAGRLLADVLLKGTHGNRLVTLVGLSLGARTIFKCLHCLAETKHDAELVERVVLLGELISITDENWEAARKMVAGRFVNAYSTKNWMLGIAFSASL